MEENKTHNTDEVKHEAHNTNHTKAQDEKIWYALAYIVFFLPLIVIPNNVKGKYHANQGLILLIVALVGNFILTLIPILGWMLIPFFSIAILAFVIIGFMNGWNEKQKPLPVIGKWFNIIK